jgi:hypothetical protein
MGPWCKRHATALAIVFAALALVLFVVVLAQAEMLYTKGWRLALGTVPEWMAGFGTVFTAIAALAAFGTLSVATKERQSLEAERQALAAQREDERRDHVMSQARLIVVEQIPGSNPGQPLKPFITIRNHSSMPIFNLHIDYASRRDSRVTVEEPIAGTGDPPVVFGHPMDRPVLRPNETTHLFAEALRIMGTIPMDTPNTEYVGFTFTDARGARWRRLGSDQPEQQFD